MNKINSSNDTKKKTCPECNRLQLIVDNTSSENHEPWCPKSHKNNNII